MSKFLQRIDTESTKFAIGIHLTKVEISLVQQCLISVTLKRGKHEKETQRSAPLEKGEALFDERLNIPATLYYVKKKEKYLPKEAVLELNIITPSTRRLAGLTKFDLSHFVNLGIQEQEVTLKVDKCFDKNAKFHFKIYFIPLKDNAPIITKVPFTGGKSMFDPNGRGGTVNDLPIPRKSRIDAVPQNLNQSEPAVTLDNLTFDSARIPTGLVPNRRTRSPGARFEANLSAHLTGHEQMVRNRRSRTVDMGKQFDQSSLNLGSGIESQTNIISEKSYDMGVSERMNELEVQVKAYQAQNKILEENAALSQENYTSVVKELEELKENYRQLEEELDCEKVNNSNANNLNAQNIEIEAKYKLRIRDLEEQATKTSSQIRDLEMRNKNLENENSELKQRPEGESPSSKKRNSKVNKLNKEHEATIKKLQEQLDEAELRNNDSTSLAREAEKRVEEANEEVRIAEERAKKAETQVKELEKKIKEINLTFENDIHSNERQIEEFQSSINSLKREIQEKDKTIEDLEVLNRSYESEIDLLKKVNKSNASEKEDLKDLKEQVQALEKRNKTTEDSYKKRVEELSKQNSSMKVELEHLKDLLSQKELESENTMAQVGLENDKLKKQVKELNAKILTLQYDGNELQYLKKRIEELRTRNETVESQLSQAKMSLATFVVDKENTENALKESEDNNRLRQEKIETLEMSMFKLKAKFGEIVNSVMETGDEDLLDRMEAIIAAEDIEDYRNSYGSNV